MYTYNQLDHNKINDKPHRRTCIFLIYYPNLTNNLIIYRHPEELLRNKYRACSRWQANLSYLSTNLLLETSK